MPYKPVASLKRHRYITIAEASDLLGGLISPGTIRDMIRAGKVPGAVMAGRRYFVLRAHVGELITDMSAGVPQAQPTTIDAMRAG
jgi:excisionase family DNA binding protein